MKGKKLLSVLLTGALLLSALGACGESAKPGASSDPAAGSNTPVSSENTVKVGVLLPLSGSTSYYGGVQLDGLEFCVDYANKNGGIQSMEGAQIELVIQDSASDPETGVSAFEKLVEEEVSAVIGPYNSTVAAATVPLAIQYEVPYVIINATSENFLSVANKYVYRTNNGSSDGDNMWRLLLDYLDSVRPDDPTDKLAIVYDSGDWGSATVETWRANAETLGYTIAVEEAVSESSTDLSTLVNKIKSEEVDLVVTACFSAATNLLVKQMADYECTAKVLGLGGGVNDIEFIENCGASAEGVLNPSAWIPSFGGAGEKATALALEFKEIYGYDMTMEVCWGWLGMATIINAIEDAASADREAVADALYVMDVDHTDWALWFSGYDGVRFDTAGKEDARYPGGVRYNSNMLYGETVGIVLVQVQDGEWKIVYPLSYTDGEDLIEY